MVDQLAEVPLFKGVDPAHRQALIDLMRRESFPKGTTVFKRGDPGDSMYIILKGKVRIYTSYTENDQDDSDERSTTEFTIRTLDKMFGEWTMLDDKPRSASAEAEEDLEVLILHRDDFRAFVRERPLVGLAMMRDLAERVRYTTKYLQRVVNATEELAQGQYEHVREVQADAASDQDADIEQLIHQFIDMVDHVQAREQHLKEGASTDPDHHTP
ncbi:MAG: cyclic nucleotide-binding domain-containing protein [Anaerolineae bacterium]|nr:cyclic nucleotide-binding domain-containing protein [Anaerolineae bacterium]